MTEKHKGLPLCFFILNRWSSVGFTRIVGSGVGIRTPIYWTKTSSPAIRRPPNINKSLSDFNAFVE